MSPAAESELPLLEVDDVAVRFGGLQALRGVHLEAEPGSVTGLIGPNGAGKTTLFNVICGYQPATTGRVRLDGGDLSSLPPHRRARLGIARTFQRLETFGSLSARDNIRVAAEVRRGWSREKVDTDRITDEILDLVGLRAVADEQVDAMPTGLARLVELGRALATQPRLLLLDEPSSGLDESESEDFGRLLLRIAETGVGILLVEHDIDLVMAVCSVIYVLDFGSILASGPPAEIQRNEAVRAAYLGVGDEAEHAIEKRVAAG
ncbi:MAG TPA: ABC transporter ATP-binding protein [Acidimicrobiales bacterium]|nr:ABC transporter ATP-binding protein [Acidimicrobiales bacterium]